MISSRCHHLIIANRVVRVVVVVVVPAKPPRCPRHHHLRHNYFHHPIANTTVNDDDDDDDVSPSLRLLLRRGTRRGSILPSSSDDDDGGIRIIPSRTRSRIHNTNNTSATTTTTWSWSCWRERSGHARRVHDGWRRRRCAFSFSTSSRRISTSSSQLSEPERAQEVEEMRIVEDPTIAAAAATPRILHRNQPTNEDNESRLIIGRAAAAAPLFIACFIDLDNVVVGPKAGRPLRREDVREFLRPIWEFRKRIVAVGEDDVDDDGGGARGRWGCSSSCCRSSDGSGDDNRSRSCGCGAERMQTKYFAIEAFGNLCTQTFRPSGATTKSSSSSSSSSSLPYCNHRPPHKPWDGNVAQTGFDDEGILRCGVCGFKVSLSKKDISKERAARRMHDNNNNNTNESLDADAALWNKLKEHMKLHDGEHVKRMRRRGKARGNEKGEKKKSKEEERDRKYRAANVGIPRRLKIDRVVNQGSRNVVKLVDRNDLFQMLREIRCVKVTSVMNGENAADEALIESAKRWMKTTRNIQCRASVRCDPVGDNLNDNAIHVNTEAVDDDDDDDVYDGGDAGKNDIKERCQYNISSNYECQGVFILYSKDADFAPLLKLAKSQGFLTVSMTDERIEDQTRRLLEYSDAVIGQSSFNLRDEDLRRNMSTVGVEDGMGNVDLDIDNESEVERYLASAVPYSWVSEISSQQTTTNDVDNIVWTFRAISKSDDGSKFMMAAQQALGQNISSSVIDMSQSASVSSSVLSLDHGARNEIGWHLCEAKNQRHGRGKSRPRILK